MIPSVLNIAVHLRHHIIEHVKFQLGSQIANQCNLQLLAINITLKIEDKCLEQRVTNAGCRRPPKVCDTRAPIALTSNTGPDGIYTMPRMDQLSEMQVRSREPDCPTPLLSMFNNAINNPVMPQNFSGLFWSAGNQRFADRGRGCFCAQGLNFLDNRDAKP